AVRAERAAVHPPPHRLAAVPGVGVADDDVAGVHVACAPLDNGRHVLRLLPAVGLHRRLCASRGGGSFVGALSADAAAHVGRVDRVLARVADVRAGEAVPAAAPPRARLGDAGADDRDAGGGVGVDRVRGQLQQGPQCLLLAGHWPDSAASAAACSAVSASGSTSSPSTTSAACRPRRLSASTAARSCSRRYSLEVGTQGSSRWATVFRTIASSHFTHGEEGPLAPLASLFTCSMYCRLMTT